MVYLFSPSKDGLQMYNKYAILQMRRCENLKMCRYSMCKCENVQMELIDNTADYKASKIKIRPFIQPINILSH
jgi:hypothetical protein